LIGDKPGFDDPDAPGDNAMGDGDGGVGPNGGGGGTDAFAPVGGGGPLGGRTDPNAAGAEGCFVGRAGGRGTVATSSLEGTGLGAADGGAGGRKLPVGGLSPAGAGKPIRSVSFFGSFRSAITTRVEVWGN